MWNDLTATRMTSQCQRYVPYEILPRRTTGRVDNARLTAPPSAVSSATIITVVAIVTEIPRTIASTLNHDDAKNNSAAALT